MMIITDPTYAALSAPQRAVLAVQAVHAGQRPDPRVLAMPLAQRAEFDRLFSCAADANIRLGRLIRELHAKAQQERLALTTWVDAAWHAAQLDEVRETVGEGDPAVARVLEGGLPLACPLSLDDLDETPAGRRAKLLKGLRDRLVSIVDRAYAAAEILKLIQDDLGADPLQPELRALLDEAEDIADFALWETGQWAGGVRGLFDASAEADVWRIFEGAT